MVTSSFYLSTLGMMDAGTATEALTSIMKGFKMEASETIDIVDKLTALDLELATSSADIATAMQKTSATAKMAGMSLDELAAAVGVISDVSQAAPESIGTSIRTMLSRYGNVKAGSFESLEGGDDSKNLNDIEKVLGVIGISIRTASGEMRSFSDVLDDVAEKWVGMSTVEQNAVGTAMAGTRQREAFNVLMENYSTYQEMVKESEESQGTSTKKMEAYYDSIEYSIEKLKAAWEEFALSLQSNGAIKGIVDFATFLVENLPKIIQIFATWMAMMNAYKLPVWIKQFGQFINPKTRGANGQYIGLRSAFTNTGMAERMMIREQKWQEQQPNYKKGDMTPVINRGVEQITTEQRATTNAIYSLGQRLGVKANGGYYGAGVGTSTGQGGIITSSGDVVSSVPPKVAQMLQSRNISLGQAQWERRYFNNPQNQAQLAAIQKMQTGQGGWNVLTAQEKAAVEQARAAFKNKGYDSSVLGTKEAIVSAYAVPVLPRGMRGGRSAAVNAEINRDNPNIAANLKQMPTAGGVARTASAEAARNKKTGIALYGFGNKNIRTDLVYDGEYGGFPIRYSDQGTLRMSVANTLGNLRQTKAQAEYFKQNPQQLAAIQKMQTAKGGWNALNKDERQLVQKARQSFVDNKWTNSSVLGGKSQVSQVYNPTLAYQQANATHQFSADRIELNHRMQAKGRLMWDGEQYKRIRNADGTYGFRNKKTGEVVDPNSAAYSGLSNAQAVKSARLKTAGLTAAAGGVTAGVTAAMSQEGSVGDKAIAGATSAVTSGLLSAIPGVGPILGSTLGPILGGFISDGILKLVHAEELAREARVKGAQEQLEALQSVASSIESLSDSLASRAEWEAADYKEVNNYISETLSTLRTNKDYREAFLENVASADESLAGMSYSDLVYLIRDGTDEQAQLISNILQSTLDSQISEATMASQEQERYDARKILEENEFIGSYYTPTSTSSSYSSDSYSAGMQEAMGVLEGLSGVEMTTTSDGYHSVSIIGANAAEQLENLEKARAAVEAKAATLTDEDSEYVHQAYEDLLEKLDKHIDAVDEANGEIENLNAEYNDTEIKEAFDKTVGMWDSLTISNSTLEEAIQVMAEDLELAGIQVYDAMGNVSTEARQLIEGYLREQDNLSSLFSTDEKTLRKMLKNSTELDSVLASVSEALEEETDYDDLVDLIEKGGQGGHEEQVKIMQQLGYSGTDENLVEQFNALRNQVYNLNPESLEDFANALGMTVDEVADLKDTMGDTTLADLLAPPQENIDKLGEMLDIMNDILDSGKMSSDNFFSILDSYPELLNAYDEAGNLISVSTDNIQKNLLNTLYGAEGGIGKTIGFNMYEDMKTNENLYDSFLEMLEANDKVSQETLDNLKKYNTFTDDAVGFIAADSAAWEQYNALFAGMNINLDEYDDLLQTIMDYQTTMIDQQIDSIQSQKDALDDVNEAREKELELIKARQKLENAQKEKKLVYREGKTMPLMTISVKGQRWSRPK